MQLSATGHIPYSSRPIAARSTNATTTAQPSPTTPLYAIKIRELFPLQNLCTIRPISVSSAPAFIPKLEQQKVNFHHHSPSRPPSTTVPHGNL